MGLVPNDPGWMHIAHDIVAQLIVLFMAISILGIRWFYQMPTLIYIECPILLLLLF